MFTIEAKGLKETMAWLMERKAGLEDVPSRFSQRDDLQRNFMDIAKTITDNTVYLSHPESPAYQRTHAIVDYIASEAAVNGKGIDVFLPVTPETQAGVRAHFKDGRMGEDPYALFFLTEYAPVWFRHGIEPRDFLALWPGAIEPSATDGFLEEVDKELAK